MVTEFLLLVTWIPIVWGYIFSVAGVVTHFVLIKTVESYAVSTHSSYREAVNVDEDFLEISNLL